MKKNILIILLVIALSIFAFGCSDKDEEVNEDTKNNDTEESETVSSVGCGEIFNQDDMSYSVIGARIENIDEVEYLVLKMEAFNKGSENYSFSSLLNVGLVDSKGNEAYLEVMFSAYEEELLDGIILGGGNKIVGELAFDISETESDDYILQLGDMMGLTDAIKITSDDIGKTYDELFESAGVSGEYTVGDTMEFEDVSITFDGVRTVSKNTYDSNYDEDGMGLLVLDMTMINNSADSLEFTSVGDFSTIRNVCSADGTELEYEDFSYTARNGVEPGETKSETFGLYYNENDKDFYLTINPDMSERENLTIVTFSIE